MRKKTINHLADTIFWYILYFLPVIAYLIYLATCGTQSIAFIDFLTTSQFNLLSDSVILTTLTSIFGSSGILPIFNTLTPFYIFSWFIGVYLSHLLVDFLIFIPKLCHKYMDKFTRSE